MSSEAHGLHPASHEASDGCANPPGADEMRAYVVAHIDEAVGRGWVVPYFQPVVRALTGKLCGFEALARWEDPTYGLLPPSQFIAPLEEARLIHKVDCHIVRQVCRLYRESVDADMPVAPISLNLSRLDFDLCDVFLVVEEAVRRYEVPRSMLNIEITETVFGTDPAFMADVVNRFRTAGYQVWMDDFGSGYSTLNVLKDFDFDELKIDMEFLSRFNEKSKTILASVVDMAKKLGVETLAEGVETDEQRRYLRSIGCEKMQGYLFGKPRPYGDASFDELLEMAGIESAAERRYLVEVGAVNTLSLSERDLAPGNKTHDYVTSMPFALAEYDGERFKVIDANRVFLDVTGNMGFHALADVERAVNDPTRPLSRRARKLVEEIADEGFARVDYMVGDTACVIRARHITTRGGKTAVLVSIDDTLERSERKRRDLMSEALPVLYSIYEHIAVIRLDDGIVEPVFGNSSYENRYEALKFDDIVSSFIATDVFPADRERYRAFMEADTLMRRIEESGENYLVGFFRIRQAGGDYAWRLILFIPMPARPGVGSRVMMCMRGTHWTNDGLFQTAFDDHVGESKVSAAGVMSSDMRLTDGGLWRALAGGGDFALFWKDRDRRFVGVNQAFLDYYGFASADEVVGRTDEEMGWHIDPVPFKDDELRVLNEGADVVGKAGQCIVRGEVRDIMATKHPVYRNGRIVGLMGFFVDVDSLRRDSSGLAELPLIDSVTGVLNYTGLESATWKFVDSYVKLGIDFAMVSVNVENFQRINEEFGYAFGEKVLARVAEELRAAAGARCAIGHVYAERFVVLVQDAPDDELDRMCADIEGRIARIANVDGTRCTVYALASHARYSEHRDIEAMKRINRDDRLGRHDGWDDESESDVITSTLLRA